MAKKLCPYCQQKLPAELSLPPMSNRQARIYEAVADSGPDGIGRDELLTKMYDGETPTRAGGIVLRVQIHGLNIILAPYNQRIRGKRFGHYNLVSTKE